MSASPEYLALQRALHESEPLYGTVGQIYTPHVAHLCAARGYRTVLDYGCGKGTFKSHLNLQAILEGAAVDVTEYDIAIPGKDDRAVLAKTYDLVVCTDVLEHIEPAYLEAVVQDLWQAARHAIFVAVHCGPAKKILADGRNAHLIQLPPRWWLEKFWKFGLELEQFKAEPLGFWAVLK